MTCNNTITTNELLNSLGIYDSSCSRKVSFINRVLRNFYSRTHMLAPNNFMESISLPSWDSSYSVTYPVYKVLWFYWRGSWDVFHSHAELIDFYCDWCLVKRLKMTRGLHFLDYRQYKMDTACDNKIHLRLPCDITNWNIIYIRWPEFVASLSDNISISNFMLTWLEHLANEMRSSSTEELNNTSYRKSEFVSWLEDAKAMSDYAPEFITFG